MLELDGDFVFEPERGTSRRSGDLQQSIRDAGDVPGARVARGARATIAGGSLPADPKEGG
jgi:hypothetical protein